MHDYRKLRVWVADRRLALDTQLDIARELGFGDRVTLKRAQEDVDTVRRMLWGLINRDS